MRSVVVELKKNMAAVLKPDGSVEIIKNKNYTPGQLLDLPEKNRAKIITFMGKYARQAAAAAIVLILGTGLLTANTYAFTTVTMDLTPSLSYSLNAFDKVIRMEALNEDGQEIVDAVADEVKGQKLDKAVSITLNGLESADYIDEDTEAVFTVGSRLPRHERLEREILGSVDDWNRDRKEHGEDKHVNAEAIEATRELRDKAKKQNLSPGRVYMDERKKPENPGDSHDVPKPLSENASDMSTDPYEGMTRPGVPSHEGFNDHEPSDDNKIKDGIPEGGSDGLVRDSGPKQDVPDKTDPSVSTGVQDASPDKAGSEAQNVPHGRSESPDIPAPQDNRQSMDPATPDGMQGNPQSMDPATTGGTQNTPQNPQEDGQNADPGLQGGGNDIEPGSGQNTFTGPQGSRQIIEPEDGQNTFTDPQGGRQNIEPGDGQNAFTGPQENGRSTEPSSQEGGQNNAPGPQERGQNADPGPQERGQNAGPGPQGGQAPPPSE